MEENQEINLLLRRFRWSFLTLVKNWLEYKGDTVYTGKEEKAGGAGGYPGCYT